MKKRFIVHVRDTLSYSEKHLKWQSNSLDRKSDGRTKGRTDGRTNANLNAPTFPESGGIKTTVFKFF